MKPPQPMPDLPILLDETEAKADLEIVVPDFPRLPGVLGKFCDAITKDIPYEHKAACLLTYVGLALSGNVVLKTHAWLQPRLYTLLVGPPGDGKTAAMKEVHAALEKVLPIKVRRSFDSKVGLIQQLSWVSHILLAADEIHGFFDKAQKPGAGTLDTVLELYEDNRAENITKKSKTNPDNEIIVTNGHFGILGGIQNERFSQLWRADGIQSGQTDRFLFTLSSNHMPIEPTPNDSEALRIAVEEIGKIVNSFHNHLEHPVEPDSDIEAESESTRPVGILGESQEAIDEAYAHEFNWAVNSQTDAYRCSNEQRNRDLAYRIAMIISTCQLHSEITGETMKLACQIADYKMKVFGVLDYVATTNNVDAMQNRILAFYDKNDGANFSLKTVSGHVRPERFPGGAEAFNRAWRALVDIKRLEFQGQSKRKQPLFGIAR